METGNHEYSAAVNDEEEHLGKAPQQCPPDGLKDNRELKWVRCYSAYGCLHFGSKSAAQTTALALVPTLRLDQF